MLITTTARHCELNPDLKQFAQQRLEKFERFARDIREVHLIVTGEKFRTTAEITLRVDHHELVSREEADEMKLAIDQAADGIERQLRRFKDKRQDRHRHGPVPGAPERPSGSGDEDGEED